MNRFFLLIQEPPSIGSRSWIVDGGSSGSDKVRIALIHWGIHRPPLHYCLLSAIFFDFHPRTMFLVYRTWASRARDNCPLHWGISFLVPSCSGLFLRYQVLGIILQLFVTSLLPDYSHHLRLSRTPEGKQPPSQKQPSCHNCSMREN